jgi:uncharacterized protein with FMN-binding domain
MPVSRRTAPRTTGKKTLANSLVTLSSAAVIAIYAAGYARTTSVAGQDIATEAVPSASASLAPSPTATNAPAATSTATAPPPTANPGGLSGQRPPRDGRQAGGAAIPAVPVTATAAATTGAASAPAAAAVGAYRDGTYTGTGTSRHGSIGVMVTVHAGKIVSAEITNCGTRYPCSRIAELPGQAVARQSAAVDVVTGATDSTNAYRAAVNAALAQAR